MIESLHLRNFKCFESLDLGLGRVTLLTGLNSTGKSSVIQSLLAVHQTFQQPGPPPNLLLNGDFVSLGSAHDAIDRLTGRGSFEIGITAHSSKLMWKFSAEDRDSLIAPLIRSECTQDGMLPTEIRKNWYPACDGNAVRKASAELRQLLHVSTERIGPQETYSADTGSGDVDRLGSRGEFTAWFLYKNQDLEVPASLRCPDEPPKLLHQTAAWLGRFFPGASLTVNRVDGTSLVTLGLRTSQADSYYRPQNVGFGLTHILPILVGGLAAASGRMFIVENPEAHLHPAAQSQMAGFLASVAAAGAQVIIESHSDHILNGLRRAVKNGILTPKDLAIHYFRSRDPVTHEARLLSLLIDQKGQISEWPDGFFDQIDRDLGDLVSWT